ncbi:metallophosphoesterase family protein [soil metagenome]
MLGLPDVMLSGLEGCDLILHAGDLNSLDVLRRLGEVAPVVAVSGNNDEPEVLKHLPAERVFNAGRHTIGLMHGHLPRPTARQSAVQVMRGKVDCVVYGHSHIPDLSDEGGLLLVNPGSPTQRRSAPHRSYAIMMVDDEIAVEFFQLP